MKKHIHILGASGAGTSTLGASLAKTLPHIHLDTDDYFWKIKFTEQTQIEERRKMLKKDLSQSENWILSGAICGWGDDFKSWFDLIIFLSVPEDIRLKRLQQRELERYGSEILPGGSKYEQYRAFSEWAALYDHAGLEVRSRVLHEHWMKGCSSPVLRIEGTHSVKERSRIVLDYLHAE